MSYFIFTNSHDRNLASPSFHYCCHYCCYCNHYPLNIATTTTSTTIVANVDGTIGLVGSLVLSTNLKPITIEVEVSGLTLAWDNNVTFHKSQDSSIHGPIPFYWLSDLQWKFNPLLIGWASEWEWKCGRGVTGVDCTGKLAFASYPSFNFPCNSVAHQLTLKTRTHS
jgi:hypothetical protein